MSGKETVYRITGIGIKRRYGFHDGGYITVGLFYKNGRKVKDFEDLVFAERSTIAENYALACCINSEEGMERLKGMEVDVVFDNECFDGVNYEYMYLTRPLKVSEKLGKPKDERVTCVCLGPVEDTEEMKVA